MKPLEMFHAGWISLRIHRPPPSSGGCTQGLSPIPRRVDKLAHPPTTPIVWWMRPGLSTLQKHSSHNKRPPLSRRVDKLAHPPTTPIVWWMRPGLSTLQKHCSYNKRSPIPRRVDKLAHPPTTPIVWWMRPGLSTLQKLQKHYKSVALRDTSPYVSTAAAYK